MEWSKEQLRELLNDDAALQLFTEVLTEDVELRRRVFQATGRIKTKAKAAASAENGRKAQSEQAREKMRAAWDRRRNRGRAEDGQPVHAVRIDSISILDNRSEQYSSSSDANPRRAQGDFATPAFYAQLAHEYILSAVPDAYDLCWWDMACGTGVLTAPCPAESGASVFLSTLNAADLSTTEALSRNPGATRFQFDFLNDDDRCLPPALIQRLERQRRWAFLLNPPYTVEKTARIATTRIGAEMDALKFEQAARQTATQFMHRILKLVTANDLDVTIGLFSQSNFMVNPGFARFYEAWEEVFGFVAGFCFPSHECEALREHWPLVFSIWKRGKAVAPITVDVIEQGKCIGIKTFKAACEPLIRWPRRAPNVVITPPFSSALQPSQSSVNLDRLPADALGFCVYPGNHVMHSKRVCILSTVYGNGTGWGITAENFEQTIVAAGARALITGHWLNDRDAFERPNTSHPDYTQFVNDVAVWLLFSNFNHSASLRGVAYKGQAFDITNQFFWQEPIAVAAFPNVPDETRRQCQCAQAPFVASWLKGSSLSPDAQWVLDYANQMLYETAELRSQTDTMFQMINFDSGWFQLRRSLLWGDHVPAARIAGYREYKRRHQSLKRRLEALVYDLEILPK